MHQKSIVTTTGTAVELLSRPGPGGYCFARLHGIADTLEVRDIHLDDLRAQGGTAEIEAVLETLPAWVELARQRAKREGVPCGMEVCVALSDYEKFQQQMFNQLDEFLGPAEQRPDWAL